MTEEQRIAVEQRGWIKLPITHEDRLICAKIANDRNNIKEKKYGAMTYQGKSRLGGAEAHYLGLLPEVGCCRRWNTNIDTRLSDTHGYHDFDVVINGRRVEVKSTTYLVPLLRVEVEHKYKDIAAFFCTYVYDADISKLTGEAYLVGWASAEKVLSQTPKRLGTNLPLNYILEEKDLTRFKKEI
jgi:hypothetical protein